MTVILNVDVYCSNSLYSIVAGALAVKMPQNPINEILTDIYVAIWCY